MRGRQRKLVSHNGQMLGIADLSSATGICFQTLLQRFNRGDRGARLVLPVRTTPRPARDQVPKGVYL